MSELGNVVNESSASAVLECAPLATDTGVKCYDIMTDYAKEHDLSINRGILKHSSWILALQIWNGIGLATLRKVNYSTVSHDLA